MRATLGIEHLLRESIVVLAFARAIRHEGLARLAPGDIAAVLRLGCDAVLYASLDELHEGPRGGFPSAEQELTDTVTARQNVSAGIFARG